MSFYTDAGLARSERSRAVAPDVGGGCGGKFRETNFSDVFAGGGVRRCGDRQSS